ncbi:hypothetical protein APHAL10511_003921 [Amanita phalloides]|nr:hypothetical protein APHAL10511_003921 [Amanita phalloides]
MEANDYECDTTMDVDPIEAVDGMAFGYGERDTAMDVDRPAREVVPMDVDIDYGERRVAMDVDHPVYEVAPMDVDVGDDRLKNDDVQTTDRNKDNMNLDEIVSTINCPKNSKMASLLLVHKVHISL